MEGGGDNSWHQKMAFIFFLFPHVSQEASKINYFFFAPFAQRYFMAEKQLYDLQRSTVHL